MNKMNSSIDEQKINLTPEKGFNLVGIDFFTDSNGQLYLIDHFELYQEALKAKNEKKNSDEYLILYKGPGNEYLSR